MPASAPAAPRASSEADAAARFVAERRPAAVNLGRALAERLNDPDGFAATLDEGLAALGDTAYEPALRRIAPGLGAAHAVRAPLLAAAQSAFAARTRRVSPSLLLYLAERLLREPAAEVRWFAVWLLGRTLGADPERSWQLLRRVAREASEWITIDTLARHYATGILLDARRWAELEQLVYSPSTWERRLVGSTLATIPFVRGLPGGRDPTVARRGLEVLGQLIGDAEPDVEKALAWALRSLVLADREAVGRFLQSQAQLAVATGDGYRAWVIRDALGKQPPTLAAHLRDRLRGIRRKPGSAGTSTAAAIAAEFLAGLPASPAGRGAR